LKVFFSASWAPWALGQVQPWGEFYEKIVEKITTAHAKKRIPFF